MQRYNTERNNSSLHCNVINDTDVDKTSTLTTADNQVVLTSLLCLASVCLLSGGGTRCLDRIDTVAEQERCAHLAPESPP